MAANVSSVSSVSNVIDVTDQSFESEVVNSEKPVLVDFWAPWCPPCHAIAPAVAELAAEYAGTVGFAKLNTDENQQTMMRYGVMGLPTLLIFKGGTEVARLVGARPKAKLKQAIDAVVA